MKRKLALSLIAFFISSGANALTCQTSDPAKTHAMYSAALQSHQAPSYTPLGIDCGPNGRCIGDGKIGGLLNWLACWNAHPACMAPAQYGEVLIHYELHRNEYKYIYGSNQVKVLKACFFRLGH